MKTRIVRNLKQRMVGVSQTDLGFGHLQGLKVLVVACDKMAKVGFWPTTQFEGCALC